MVKIAQRGLDADTLDDHQDPGLLAKLVQTAIFLKPSLRPPYLNLVASSSSPRLRSHLLLSSAYSAQAPIARGATSESLLNCPHHSMNVVSIQPLITPFTSRLIRRISSSSLPASSCIQISARLNQRAAARPRYNRVLRNSQPTNITRTFSSSAKMGSVGKPKALLLGEIDQ